MAVCKYCSKEMSTDHTSCYPKIKIGDTIYDRISYGDNRENFPFELPCHDCNVSAGEYHHFGCDVERCPVCGNQLLMHILDGGKCQEGGKIISLISEFGTELILSENDFGIQDE